MSFPCLLFMFLLLRKDINEKEETLFCFHFYYEITYRVLVSEERFLYLNSFLISMCNIFLYLQISLIYSLAYHWKSQLDLAVSFALRVKLPQVLITKVLCPYYLSFAVISIDMMFLIPPTHGCSQYRSHLPYCSLWKLPYLKNKKRFDLWKVYPLFAAWANWMSYSYL